MADKNIKERSQRRDDIGSTEFPVPSFSLPRVFEDLMRPFEQFMQPHFPDTGFTGPEFHGREPNIDIQDRGDHFVLTGELPGFDRKDIDVRVSPDSVELKAEKRSEKDSENSNGAERQSSYSYFQRYYSLPEPVLTEKVDGTMKNGVLELKLPKREPRARAGSRRVNLR